MKRLCLILTLSGWTLSAGAQVERNSHTWVQLTLRTNWRSGWSWLNEGYVRRTFALDRWQQFQFRPYLVYRVAQGFDVGLGYTYLRTWPYSQLVRRPAPVPEHHGFVHLGLQHQPAGRDRLLFQHRYRLERRWIGRLGWHENDWQVLEWQPVVAFALPLFGRVAAGY